MQSARSLDRAQGGLGIGLSIVKRLIQMHHGSVRAASAGPEHGSTFEIRLPLVPPPDPSETKSSSVTPNARRILIVDDNADAADTLALVLRARGHRAEMVYGSAAALARLETFDAEVVLLDIGLPQMDGYEVARSLRAKGSRAMLVALTGYAQEEDRKQAQAAGFDAHLAKPVDFGALDRVLSSLPSK